MRASLWLPQLPQRGERIAQDARFFTTGGESLRTEWEFLQAETVTTGIGFCAVELGVGAEVFSYGRNHFWGFLKHVDVEHRHGGVVVLAQTVPETMGNGGYET